MIENKNFMKVALGDIPKDMEYRHCNFARKTCVHNSGKPKGHRLFPDDDTPRTFFHCNMVNIEPPPGSIFVKSNSTIKDFAVFDSSEVIIIDSSNIDANSYVDIIYGRYRDGIYEYESIPIKVPVKIKNVKGI